MNQTDKKLFVSLQYLKPNSQDLKPYVPSVGGGAPARDVSEYVKHAVLIEDGRKAGHQFSLDVEGFQLQQLPTQIDDFYDDEQIVDVYEPRVKQMLLGVTGAKQIEIFDHTRRSSSKKIQQQKGIRESASVIHNDYTAKSGLSRLEDFFTLYPHKNSGVEFTVENRSFSIVNVWRSINGPIRNYPLAMCDATSVSQEDLMTIQRKSKERIGEIQLAIYNSGHRWYYFPDMQMDEAILFKTFDSRADGRARFTLHTAFDDPNADDGAPPRESLETRCFVFF